MYNKLQVFEESFFVPLFYFPNNRSEHPSSNTVGCILPFPRFIALFSTFLCVIKDITIRKSSEMLTEIS